MNASPNVSPPGNAELDEEQARVLSKVRRLMAISLGLTGLAIAVVLVIVGFRIAATGESARPAAEAALMLPKGARLLATTVTADRIAVTAEIGGQTEIRLFDLHTLAPRGTLRVTLEP